MASEGEFLKQKMFIDYLNPALGIIETQVQAMRTEDLQGVIKRLAQIEGHCWAELERRHKEENERDMASKDEIANAIKKLGRPRGFEELTAEEQQAARRQVCKLLETTMDSVAYITDNAAYFDDGRAQFRFRFSHEQQ